IEAETRKFFLPFENEFFYHRVQLELQERSMLQKINDNHLDDFFLDFWKIDRSLPGELTVKLCAMLPFVKEIVGDFKMTAGCLGAILGEEVVHSIHYKTTPYIKTDNNHRDEEYSLGNANLGINLIAGGNFLESGKIIRFCIGPLIQTGITPYLENGDIALFIDCFCNYFVPMEMEAEFEVLMPKELQGFMLGDENEPAIMGFTTGI
ncbi:MAG TPA: hypothetical protein VIH57_07985, partial [Bacteroidales bacterium]